MALDRHYDICTKQVACDGKDLRGERRVLGICFTCEEKLKKRVKVIPPRGINYHDNLTVGDVEKVRGARPWAE